MTAPEPNDGPGETEEARGGLGLPATLTLIAALVAVTAGAVVLIFRTEPTPERGGATKQTAMLVEVTRAEGGTFRPRFRATGTVRPAREVILRPRVEGRVVERAPSLDPGATVTAGETLVRLDPADYENTLAERESALRQARAELALERGRQTVAEAEVDLFEGTLGGDSRALALREPQLRAARARVAAAEAAVAQARLELERTTVTAPFDAHVLSRDVAVGSRVAAGDRLARLVGVARYWVEATVPVERLRWLRFPQDGERPGARARIRDRSAWPADVHRTGRLERVIGRLEDDTRLARVLITVPDPLARKADKPRLLVNGYVHVRIRGRPLADVVRLDRDLLRQEETVWVMADGELAIHEVTIATRDAEHVYIRDGLDAGERVVTSDLATIRDGAPLRLRGAGDDGEAGS